MGVGSDTSTICSSSSNGSDMHAMCRVVNRLSSGFRLRVKFMRARCRARRIGYHNGHEHEHTKGHTKGEHIDKCASFCYADQANEIHTGRTASRLVGSRKG